MANAGTSPAQALCDWIEDSRKFFLYADPTVITRLGIDVWTAFKKIPRRGLEVGGILLGSADANGDTVHLHITDYQLVESEHRLGPSYLLSEADFGHFLSALENNRAGTLGAFRSQTRSEDLEPERSDTEMLERCFDSARPLFLLLCPAAKKASFFAQVEGKLMPVHEFPLARLTSSLRIDNASAVSARDVAAPKEPMQPDVSELHSLSRAIQDETTLSTGEPPAVNRPERMPGTRRAGFIAAAIALLLAGAALDGLLKSRRPVSAPSATRAFIHLAVRPEGSSLRLMWDPNAPELRSATHAVLHIQDGGSQIDRELALSDLIAGSFSYDAKGTDVTFRLDIYDVAPSASGVVEALQYHAENAAEATKKSSTAEKVTEPVDVKPSAPVPSSTEGLATEGLAKDGLDKEGLDKDGLGKDGLGKDGLGFSIQAIPSEMARTLHLSDPFGALVADVTPGSPAAISGLKRGDVILSVDGERIETFRQLASKIRSVHGVKPTTLWILSKGVTRQIKVAPTQ